MLNACMSGKRYLYNEFAGRCRALPKALIPLLPSPLPFRVQGRPGNQRGRHVQSEVLRRCSLVGTVSFPPSLAVRRCQFARPLDSRTTRTH